jgi:Acetyl-CoA carboxylase, carboxyltransferase component (subunits alpha and beta)
MDENKKIIEEKIEKLYQLKKQALLGGGEKRIEAQHKKHKLTARERLELLVDDGSFNEIDALAHHHSTSFGLDKEVYLGDGVVVGYGNINNRKVMIYSQDFTVLGGSLADNTAVKSAK